MLSRIPRKRAGFDDDAADHGPVAADEFRRGVGHDVGAPLDRAAQCGRGEGVVDDERQRRASCATRASAARSATFPSGLPIVSVKSNLRVRTDRCGERRDVVARYERALDTHALERHGELRDRSAVEVRRRNDVIAALRDREHRAELRAESARGGDGAESAFEASHALFESRDRRVADAAIDVAVGAQSEQLGRVLGRIEHEARGQIDRHRPRAGRGIGRRARVQRARAETELVVFHVACFRRERVLPLCG